MVVHWNLHNKSLHLKGRWREFAADQLAFGVGTVEGARFQLVSLSLEVARRRKVIRILPLGRL